VRISDPPKRWHVLNSRSLGRQTDLEAFSPIVGGPTSGSVKMVAGQDFKKGEEVCYSYTDTPRGSYLLNTWGFYEAGAKADFFVWMRDLQNITGMNDLNWVRDYLQQQPCIAATQHNF
jgi:hypothetical protein